ncbi:MAG: peptidase [Nitrosopumilus sp.]|nr:peptidase [Nitrosopumilus sp.]CAI9831121.1 conserved exported hypothetical protein [Nitrosopumilaceae archaeon]MDA7942394.1 peptidase [Nitrosopumilus sp.]MDA7944884.1 peptidase [Nitrosopumilus sp.]MDA7953746.1 peptidase [Nitrosopumilus sp.]
MGRIALVIAVAALAAAPAAAYGHGQGLDTIRGVLADGRELDVEVQMPADYGGGAGDITITALGDGEPVEDVTLLVGLYRGERLVFRNYFFAADGSVEMRVEPSGGDVKIRGERTGLLDAWSGDPVVITGPVLDSGGLYRFEIEVRTAGDRSRITESDTYEADVSVADTYGFGQFSIRSYFDVPGEPVYDGGSVAFGMPFDWRESKISHIPVVHVEVRFPKSSSFFTPGYEGYVNGQQLSKSSVTIDDYSRGEERVVHFVLLEDHLRRIKAALEAVPDVMEFELRSTDVLEFPLSAFTLDEEFEVSLSWNPVEIEPGSETEFVFTIRDGATGEPLRNSDYTMVLLSSGEEIHRASGTAQIGGYFERFTFSEDHAGPVTVRFEDIRGTGKETEFGIVVVPEFGLLYLVLAASAAPAVIARRALRCPCFGWSESPTPSS